MSTGWGVASSRWYQSESKSQRELNGSRIIGERNLGIVEVDVRGDEVVARIGAGLKVRIVDLTGSKLRMVERVIHFGSKLDQLVLRNGEALAEREIKVVYAPKGKRRASAVGVGALASEDVPGIRVCCHIGDDT